MMTEHQDASSAQQIILTFEIAPENTRGADDAMVNAVGYDTIEALSKDGVCWLLGASVPKKR